jgi:hypothetical protein
MGANMVWKSGGGKRLAKCLVTLIDQIDQEVPSRDKHNDGTIGDLAHQGRESDHNPHVAGGVVTALDVTDDPASGFDAGAFAETLREAKDPRIKYVIFKGRIFSSEKSWVWRDRNKGRGDHAEHVHISVVSDPKLFDDTRPWPLGLPHGASSAKIAAAFPPKLKLGSSGPAVVDLQNLLGIEADGDFGSDTDQAVRDFQTRNNLFVDGIVGSDTWAALTDTPTTMVAKAEAAGVSPTAMEQIARLAGESELARVRWADRGVAPRGYIKGMAVTFGHVYAKWKAGDSAARVMAAMNSGNDATDALAWYDSRFRELGMDNSVAGAATLRHLFVLLIGLGMRESSGKFSAGRDMSAHNVDADTAEAGLFQMSWNARGASPELPKLFATYTAKPEGFLSVFKEGVAPKDSDGDTFGTGQGLAFQRLCKSCPAFAVEAAAVGLRVLRKHWGPIVRREAEIRPEADKLLQEVQRVVDMTVPVAGPVRPQQPDGTETLSILEALRRIIEQSKGGGAPMTIPVNVPPTPVANSPVSLLEQVAKLLQTLNPQARPPEPPAAAADQQIEQLRKIIMLLNPIINPGAVTVTAPLAKPPLGPVNGALGQTIGNLLDGKKTALGTIGAVATSLLTSTATTGTGIGQVLTGLVPAVGLSQFAMPIFLGMAAWGVLGKMEKWQGGQGKVEHTTPAHPPS